MDGLLEQVDTPLRVPAPSRVNATWHLSWFLLAGAVLSMLLLDSAVGERFSTRKLGGELGDILSTAEHFGTPYGQLMILLVILTVQQWREPRVVRIFVGASAAGLAADVIKLMVARTRPRSFDFAAQSIWEGFTGLFPFGAGGSPAQSFPSAHTACAFGFAALMSWAWPNGRAAFLTIAILTGLQRICVAAHFPSDVLAGAAVGWLVGQLFVSWAPLSERFSKLERRWGVFELLRPSE